MPENTVTAPLAPMEPEYVADVLRQLEAAGMKQPMEAHPVRRTTA